MQNDECIYTHMTVTICNIRCKSFYSSSRSARDVFLFIFEPNILLRDKNYVNMIRIPDHIFLKILRL
jgi:hypothetical protein